MRKKQRPIIHFALVLAGIFSVTVQAAQVVPGPLSLTVTWEPLTPVSGDQLTFWFDVQNVGDAALQQVQLEVILPPQGMRLQTSAADNETWNTFTLNEEIRTLIYYTADEMAAGAAARLSLTVLVDLPGGQSLVLDTYQLTAQELESPIAGEPISILVATATGTPAPTTTPLPSPTPSPSPSPSPTVTVVMAELPPTPTPKLSNEQEQLGALTVSIFVFLALAIGLAAAIWIFRKNRQGG